MYAFGICLLFVTGGGVSQSVLWADRRCGKWVRKEGAMEDEEGKEGLFMKSWPVSAEP